jgi:hypothetical protein
MMSAGQVAKIHVGKGILKPGTQNITVHVDKDGEYWLCEAEVDPRSEDFRKEGCVTYREAALGSGG